MWRWILNTLALLSLPVLFVGASLWIRSFSVGDSVSYEYRANTTITIASFDQRFVLVRVDAHEGLETIDTSFQSKWEYHKAEHALIDHMLVELKNLAPNQHRLFGLRYYESPPKSENQPAFTFYGIEVATHAVVIPYWYIVPPAMVLPLWWLLRGRKTSKHFRRKHGLCLGCGYDLRGTQGDCPECGRAATVLKPS